MVTPRINSLLSVNVRVTIRSWLTLHGASVFPSNDKDCLHDHTHAISG